MMERILYWLRKINIRVASIIIGVLAVLFLVYWCLGLVGIKTTSWRVIAEVIVLAGFAALYYGGKWYAQHKGASLTDALQADSDGGAGKQLEIAVLRERMNESIQALKSSGLGTRYKGKAALYALPWYVIIGPSAAGKSTLLRNSGLNFPYSHGDDVTVKGFGGTRNCDWWFSDEAILLDTAGRYTTEDEDHSEWMSFINLLKRYRRKMPINGVIVAVSFSDILTCDDNGLDWHVKVIRNRIEELNKQLDYTLPIYLVFTKLDLIKGFDIFFSESQDQEREQVWGMSDLIKYEGADFDKAISREYEQLLARLSSQRLRKLAIERDQARKQAIFDFPDQFAAALNRIKPFIEAIRKDNPYQEGSGIYGIYFTSADQANEAQQCLSLEKNRRFSFAKRLFGQQILKSRGYFIKDLFSKVIFAKQDIAMPSKKRIFSSRFLKGSGITAALAAVIAMTGLFSASLHANKLLLERGALVSGSLSQQVESRNSNQLNHITALLSAYDYYNTLQANKANLPLHMRLGLYRGNDLLSPLSSTMSVVMQNDFLPLTAGYLESELKSYATKWANANPEQQKKMYSHYYNALKTYLMLCYPKRIDTGFSSAILASDWQKALEKSFPKAHVNFSGPDLTGLVSIYLDQLKAQSQTLTDFQLKTWMANTQLINKARKQLYSPLNANILFEAVKLKASSQFSSVSIGDLMSDSSLFTSSNLSGLYTKQAWEGKVQTDIQAVLNDYKQGDWVIDGDLTSLNSSQVKFVANNQGLNDQQFDKLKQALYEKYFENYNQAWLTFLSSISVRQFNSLDDANRSLQTLEGVDGPMSKLLHVIMKNTQFSNPAAQMSIQPSVQEILEGGSKGGNLVSYFLGIRKMKSDIENLDLSPTLQQSTGRYATALLSGGGLNSALYKSSIVTEKLLMNVSNPTVEKALAPLMLSPTREAWRAIANQAVESLAPKWQTQVVASYQQSLQGKFPFSMSGEDADLQDVSQFLNPQQGVLWQFVHASLSPYIQLENGQWKAKTWLGVGASFAPGFLKALTQAQHISQAFFAQGEAAPGFSIDVYPYPIPNISEISLNTSGDTYHYNNGPQQWRRIKWTAVNFNDDTQLNVMSSTGENISTQDYTGTWGLFHLLASAKLTPETNNTYQAIWRLNGPEGKTIHVRLLFKDEGQNNILGLLTHPFYLPKQLTTQNNA